MSYTLFDQFCDAVPHTADPTDLWDRLSDVTPDEATLRHLLAWLDNSVHEDERLAVVVRIVDCLEDEPSRLNTWSWPELAGRFS